MRSRKLLLTITAATAAGVALWAAAQDITGKPPATDPPAAAGRHLRQTAGRLEAARKANDAAGGAVGKGDKAGALAELAKARNLVAATHARLLQAAGPAFANVRCPMMGAPIDPKNVPAGLTRPHKGRTVAFCCAGCPKAWDNLPQAEKDARLAKVAHPDHHGQTAATTRPAAKGACACRAGGGGCAGGG